MLPFGPRHKAKSAKYTLKSRNQIIIKYSCGIGLRYLAISIILMSLRVEAALYLVHDKILLL